MAIHMQSHAELFAPHDTMLHRHIGPDDTEVQDMLKTVGLSSLDELAARTVPDDIKLPKELSWPGHGEFEMLQRVREVAKMNRHEMRSLIGMGYYNTITPPVILRNVLESPAWYTPYTPYQAEVSQGRLESLLNFQTMVQDLTALDVANASLLDEATAAAEAMNLAVDAAKGGKRRVFFVSEKVHPQTLAVIQTRAAPLGITVIVGDHRALDLTAHGEQLAGALVQYPATDGSVEDFSEFTAKVKAVGAVPICATDLLALTLLKAPGEMGFEIALGSSQRFGVPPGYGGPHAAFFAVAERHKRIMPGRLIGVSRDAQGKLALRMALQTREQHIRREKATSNICTAQALLANVAAMYAVYHGPHGLKGIASKIHGKTQLVASALSALGYSLGSASYFDTLSVTGVDAKAVAAALEQRGINIAVRSASHVTLSLDERVSRADVENLVAGFAAAKGVSAPALDNLPAPTAPAFGALSRTSAYLTHPIFNTHHSETEMLRYIYQLQSKDIGLQTSMIPLGSCTMKLNATTEMIPITMPEFADMHPFVPLHQAQGYQTMLRELESYLSQITGFPAVSLQPNAGSQGEYTGLMVIRAYLHSKGETQRDVCLIPLSAHGTNPASAVMAGFKVVVVNCDEKGNVDTADLKAKAEQYKDRLAALMMTYPSTHGVFEMNAREIVDIVHANGGQVYLDGANMNAQVGLTSPGFIGADVCHLNLHKTFCIPHGGGGPGMGPIGVAAHLAPFLPSHPVVPECNPHPNALGPVSAAPWGSADILSITWIYIQLMGSAGLKRATQVAMLSANYMAKRLEGHYPILYRGESGLNAHEFIIDLRHFKSIGIQAEDVAKRLMDYGFHAPTMSFPVPNTLMIEPTESEPKPELDRLCDALIDIRRDIRDIEEGRVAVEDSVLRHAPHTQEVVMANEWNRKYSRERAAYPLPYLRKTKTVWPTVSRIDNVYGDRNLICSCPPLESYQ